MSIQRQIIGLLVRRNAEYFESPRFNALDTPPSINYKLSEICTKYSGIEGEFWPLRNTLIESKLRRGVAPLAIRGIVIDYFNALREQELNKLLYIQSVDSKVIAPPEFKFLGYDIGAIASEYDHFSIVFNEIIFGKYSELRAMATELNEFLLFSRIEDTKKTLSIRKNLANTGADIESLEDSGGELVIAIYTAPTK